MVNVKVFADKKVLVIESTCRQGIECNRNVCIFLCFFEGTKTSLEKEKTRITSIFSLSHNVFRSCFPQGQLTLYSIDTHFNASTTALENIVGKEEIARNEQFLHFPQCFLLKQKIVSPFVSIFFKSYFYLLLNWKSLKLA